MKNKRIKIKLIVYNLIVSFVFFSLIWAFDLKEEYILMLLYSLNSAIVFILLFREEFIHYKGLSPNLLLLVGYTMRLVYPSIEMSIEALQGESFELIYTYNDITDYIFPTAVWMNIYYMIFYYAFNRFSNEFTIDKYIIPYLNKYHFTAIAVALFVPGLIYEIAISYIPAFIIPSIINKIFGNLTKLAMLIMVFNAGLMYTNRKHRILVLLVIVEMLRATIWGFYKSAIMMPFIFYLLYLFLHAKNQGKPVLTPRLIVMGGTFFLFLSLFVYPFMTMKRVEAGFSVELDATGMATKDYSNLKIAKDVLNGRKTEQAEEVSTTGRLNAIRANAFFYKECVTKKLRTTELAKSNAELLVPRFLNPNKHVAEAGLMTFSYIYTGSFKNYDTAVSNNYIGQFASAYLMGGGFLAILLAFLNGFIMIKYYNYLIKNITNVFALLFLIGQLFSTLEGFEEIHDGGVLRIGLALVYSFIIFLTNPFFNRLRVKKQRERK